MDCLSAGRLGEVREGDWELVRCVVWIILGDRDMDLLHRSVLYCTVVYNISVHPYSIRGGFFVRTVRLPGKRKDTGGQVGSFCMLII